MKEGDLITTYYKGFHRLKKIERRYVTQRDIDTYSTYKDRKVGEEYSPLYYFIQEYTEDGKSVQNRKERVCDASFCKLASDYISEEIIKTKEKETRLLNILNIG